MSAYPIASVAPAKSRRFAANSIRLLGVACSLAAFWQVVRFWNGDVGLPLVDQAFGMWSLEPLRPAIGDGVVGALGFVYAGLAGTAYWVGAGGVASVFARNVALIIERGWTAWTIVCATEAAEARRQERLSKLRDLRRQAREKRSGGSGLFALVAGIAIGVWLS